MTEWRIVAVAPTEPVDGCLWREAGDAACAVATSMGIGFELILVGQTFPTGVGWPGLSRVTLASIAEQVETAAQFSTIVADLLADGPSATLVFAPPDPFGEEIAAALAVLTRGRALGHVRAIAWDGDRLCATRGVYGGRAEITLSYPAGLITVAMRSVPVAEDAPPLPAPVVIDTEMLAPAGLVVEHKALAGRKTPLEGAKLVVAGGRGLDEAGFALLDEIADALGAAVGGSLPAVDAGLLPVSRQVGQSGKFVTPELYLAVGLSGTPQHLAGIGTATRLVVINSDPSAPIFSYAELGFVMDAREMLPLLLDALVKRGS